MRRLVIFVIVVLVLGAAADFGTRAYAESRLAANVQAGLGLSEKPALELRGFPFLLALSRGELSSAGFEADGVVNDGLRVERVELDLREVRFSTSAILSESPATTIRAATGSGRATVTAEDLSAFIAERGYPGRIRFGMGEATVEATFGTGVDVSATGPLQIDDAGRIVFAPQRLDAGGASFPAALAAFTFELPKPFEGFTYTGIDVTEGSATLRISIRDAVIPIQERRG